MNTHNIVVYGTSLHFLNVLKEPTLVVDCYQYLDIFKEFLNL